MAPWEEGTEGERFSEDTSRRASRLAEKKAEAFLLKGNRGVIQSSTCTTRARARALYERAVSLAAQQP